MTLFNSALHPRAGDGTFTETYHPEAPLILEPSAAAQLDLAFIDAVADDVRIAAGHYTADRNLSAAEEDAAWDKYRAANDRLKMFGGADKAVIAVGEMIATRGETIAGISVNEIRGAAFIRTAAAKDTYDAALEAWTDRLGGAWDEDRYVAKEEARIAYSQALCGRDEDTKKDLRRLADGYLEALREVRPMGGDLQLHEKSDVKAVGLFKDAAQFYPTEWIEASNAYNPLVANYVHKRGHYKDTISLPKTVKAPKIDTRAHRPGEPAPDARVSPMYDWAPTGKTTFTRYRDKETGKYEFGDLPEYESVSREVIFPGGKFRAKKDGTPWGAGWEQWFHPETGEMHWRRLEMVDKEVDAELVSQLQLGKRKANNMEGRDPDLATATHEIGHRMQYTVGNLNDLERTFLYRRTLVPSEDYPDHMEQQALEPVSPDDKKVELCRPDHFTNRYMGRDYPKVTEIVTMGMESLFTGTNGGLIGIGKADPDREFRDFVLGAVATAGGANKHERPLPAFLQ